MSPIHFSNAELSYLKVYDESTIKTIFEWFANDSQIEFNFPQGGCQQRAQIMSMFLKKKFQLDHLKVWLLSPSALFPGDNRQLFIDDKNDLTGSDKIEWTFHVAPVVLMQVNKDIKTMVIDPSINAEAALPVDEWFGKIGNSHAGKYTFLTPDKYFYFCYYTSDNRPTTLFEGTFFTYDNPVKDDLTMEKGLAINDMAILIFNKYIKPLELSENENDHVKMQGLKEIFGNATALDYLFSLNVSGQTPNTSHRYFINHFSEICEEAKALFNQRLIYWTGITNQLLSI
jgi:hypothetical protein